MIRRTKIRWLIYEEDMESWDLCDEEEDHLNRNSRSREREADNIKALRHDEFSRFSSRSRGRSMIILGIFQEKYPEIDGENVKMKEKRRNMLSGKGHFGFTFTFL